MDTACSIIDISEVLGPLWTQAIDKKDRRVVLTYDDRLKVNLVFDKDWNKFSFSHDVPNDAMLIDMNYMNDWEGYYYGIWVITACQKPFIDWVESIRCEL